MTRTRVQQAARAARRLPSAALLLFVLAVATFASASATRALQFDRSAIMAGQIWRIATCHWTHWSLDHLVWDALAFVVLGALCERRDRTATFRCILLSALVIPATIGLADPRMVFYRGLSGIDSALFLLLAVLVTRSSLSAGQWRPAALAAALTLAFVGKVTFESITGAAVFANQQAAGYVVVPIAHASGAAVGLLVGCTTRRRTAGRRTRTPIALPTGTPVPTTSASPAGV